MDERMRPTGVDEPLGEDEARERARLELEVYTNRALYRTGIFGLGTALGEINDKLLYRVSHRTFESYVQATFSMSGNQAYRLIAAARVAKAAIEESRPERTVWCLVIPMW